MPRPVGPAFPLIIDPQMALVELPYIPGYLYSYPAHRTKLIEAHRTVNSGHALRFGRNIVSTNSALHLEYQNFGNKLEAAIVSEQLNSHLSSINTKKEFSQLYSNFDLNSNVKTKYTLMPGFSYISHSGRLSRSASVQYAYEISNFLFINPMQQYLTSDWTIGLTGSAWKDARPDFDPGFQLGYYSGNGGIYDHLCSEIEIRKHDADSIGVTVVIHNFSPFDAENILIKPFVRVFDPTLGQSLTFSLNDLQSEFAADLLPPIRASEQVAFEFRNLKVPSISDHEGYQVIVLISSESNGDELWNNVGYNTFPPFKSLPFLKIHDPAFQTLIEEKHHYGALSTGHEGKPGEREPIGRGHAAKPGGKPKEVKVPESNKILHDPEERKRKVVEKEAVQDIENQRRLTRSDVQHTHRAIVQQTHILYSRNPFGRMRADFDAERILSKNVEWSFSDPKGIKYTGHMENSYRIDSALLAPRNGFHDVVTGSHSDYEKLAKYFEDLKICDGNTPPDKRHEMEAWVLRAADPGPSSAEDINSLRRQFSLENGKINWASTGSPKKVAMTLTQAVCMTVAREVYKNGWDGIEKVSKNIPSSFIPEDIGSPFEMATSDRNSNQTSGRQINLDLITGPPFEMPSKDDSMGFVAKNRLLFNVFLVGKKIFLNILVMNLTQIV